MLRTLLLFVVVFISVGCATTSNLSSTTEEHDPFEGYNRAIYSFNEEFDRVIAKPVAEVYQKVTPMWLDKGITNFFSNLDDVVVLANDILQLKPIQAASDTGRIIVNSTIGLLGFFDVASHMGLPKHNEDFGQTLGYWGVPSGPYFVLPFWGPSTIRDTAGLGTDYYLFDPVFRYVKDPATSNSMFIIDTIDFRADLLNASNLLEKAALDPYLFVREAYLQRRHHHIYDGSPPVVEGAVEDEVFDPFAEDDDEDLDELEE